MVESNSPSDMVDSKYLPPSFDLEAAGPRGSAPKSEPSLVPSVCSALAAAVGMSVAEVMRSTGAAASYFVNQVVNGTVVARFWQGHM